MWCCFPFRQLQVVYLHEFWFGVVLRESIETFHKSLVNKVREVWCLRKRQFFTPSSHFTPLRRRTACLPRDDVFALVIWLSNAWTQRSEICHGIAVTQV